MIARLIALALLLAVCVQTWRLTAEQAGRKADRAAYAAAQAQAEAMQIATNKALTARYRTLSKGNANDYRQALSRVRSAVSAYVSGAGAAGRMCHQAAPGASGGTATAAMPVDPAPPVDAAAFAGMVELSRADLDQLADAAVQNASRGNFLQALVDDGLAVAD